MQSARSRPTFQRFTSTKLHGAIFQTIGSFLIQTNVKTFYRFESRSGIWRKEWCPQLPPMPTVLQFWTNYLQCGCRSGYVPRHYDVWGAGTNLTLALDGEEWPASRPGRFTAWKEAQVAGWVAVDPVWTCLWRKTKFLPVPVIEPPSSSSQSPV